MQSERHRFGRLQIVALVAVAAIAGSLGWLCQLVYANDDPTTTVTNAGPAVQTLQKPEILIRGSADDNWYTAEEIYLSALEYIRLQRIEFDLTDAEVVIWADLSAPDIMATVVFVTGIGKPCLSVYINRENMPIKHSIDIGIDRITVSEQVYQQQLDNLDRLEQQCRTIIDEGASQDSIDQAARVLKLIERKRQLLKELHMNDQR